MTDEEDKAVSSDKTPWAQYCHHILVNLLPGGQ